MSVRENGQWAHEQLNRSFMILKIKLTQAVHLSVPWVYKHVYDNNGQTNFLVYISQISDGFSSASPQNEYNDDDHPVSLTAQSS